MKIHSTFHVLVLFMAVLIFSMPFVTLAQQNSGQAEAMITAEQDANKDVNKPFWVGAGCLLSGASLFLPTPFEYIMPPAGAIGTYFYRPAPPPARLIGKSPEYITAYTSVYQLKRGDIQARWTSVGCLVIGAVVVNLRVGFRIGTETATQ